jgi:hypothetical protein
MKGIALPALIHTQQYCDRRHILCGTGNGVHGRWS